MLGGKREPLCLFAFAEHRVYPCRGDRRRGSDATSASVQSSSHGRIVRAGRDLRTRPRTPARSFPPARGRRIRVRSGTPPRGRRRPVRATRRRARGRQARARDISDRALSAEFAEQVVVAVPAPVAIERDHERVRLLEFLSTSLESVVSSTASHSGAVIRDRTDVASRKRLCSSVSLARTTSRR